MHVRVQSWFPFTVDICLNGREWLARQLDERSIAYQQRDNCFMRVADPLQAQLLLDQQLTTNWKEELEALLIQAHPLHAEIAQPIAQRYYWSASQTEFATDVCFKGIARRWRSSIRSFCITLSAASPVSMCCASWARESMRPPAKWRPTSEVK